METRFFRLPFVCNYSSSSLGLLDLAPRLHTGRGRLFLVSFLPAPAPLRKAVIEKCLAGRLGMICAVLFFRQAFLPFLSPNSFLSLDLLQADAGSGSARLQPDALPLDEARDPRG